MNSNKEASKTESQLHQDFLNASDAEDAALAADWEDAYDTQVAAYKAWQASRV